MLSNVKNSITGTYHSMNAKHLPRYLAEYCYRFNRRFTLGGYATSVYVRALDTRHTLFKHG